MIRPSSGERIADSAAYATVTAPGWRPRRVLPAGGCRRSEDRAPPDEVRTRFSCCRQPARPIRPATLNIELASALDAARRLPRGSARTCAAERHAMSAKTAETVLSGSITPLRSCALAPQCIAVLKRACGGKSKSP